MIAQILSLCTEESDNPDLRNRAYIYWRMITADPESAKQVILCEKPVLSEETSMSSNFDKPMLEKLVEQIGTLASVYSKPPEAFVKKI